MNFSLIKFNFHLLTVLKICIIGATLLILTRKLGEIINIGNDIKIQVVSIHGKQVRIGIEAPQTMEIHRQEIYEKIKIENNLAKIDSQKEVDLKELSKEVKDLVNKQSAGNQSLKINN